MKGQTMERLRTYQRASGGVLQTGMLSTLGIALLVTLILPRPLQAAPGDLDPSFGSGGIVITDFGGSESAAALALQKDRKIVAAGRSFFAFHPKFVLARYEGGPSDGAPFLKLDLNQKSFVPGETLRAEVLEANFGPEVMLDRYFGALLPSGTGPAFRCPADDAIVFLTTRIVLTCLSAPPQTFEPWARNFLLPAGLPASSTPDFFSFVWPSEAPMGTYTFFVAFTRAGTVDIVALATASANPSLVSPEAPSGLTATAACETVTISWRDNSSGETGFRIERKSEGGSFVEMATVGPGVTSYEDRYRALMSVTHSYFVYAFTGTCPSGSSNISSVER